MKARYWVLDRGATQARELTSFSYLNPRYWVIDRTSNLPVDEATTRYEARQAAQHLNRTEA